MHIELLAPLWPILIAGLACLPVIILAVLISRHRLSKRHRALKACLERVVGERDAARFALRHDASVFDHFEKWHADRGTEFDRQCAAKFAEAGHQARKAAGDIVGDALGRLG